MHNKLKELINKLKLEAYEQYFNNGSIKLFANTKEKSWTFNINIDQLLPIEIFSLLTESLTKTFADVKGIKDIKLYLNVKNINYNLATLYWNYTLTQLVKSNPTIMMFDNNNINIDNKTLTIEVNNKVEQNKLLKLKDKIEALYNSYGFKKLELNPIINEEKRNEVKAEISNSLKIEPKKVIKPKQEDNIIYGSIIKSKSDKISNILNEENDVTIEGIIFGIDYFESSKNNFKIITLKITDYTDSMYVKVFTRDDEEYNYLKKSLATNDWVKVKGYTKNDMYAKDLVLNARDINKIEPKDEKKDDTKAKRIELHAHTHMSQMDSVVSAKDLI